MTFVNFCYLVSISFHLKFQKEDGSTAQKEEEEEEESTTQGGKAAESSTAQKEECQPPLYFHVFSFVFTF